MEGISTIRIDVQCKPTNITSVLVLGLGNTLLADDGVGVHVVRRLAQDAAKPDWLRPLDGGTLGFRLASIMSGETNILIVDAAHLDRPPGTVQFMDRSALAAYVSDEVLRSAHEAGLANLITLAELEGFAPRRLGLVAIQPRRIDWGDELSESVSDAVDEACKLVVDIARAWCLQS